MTQAISALVLLGTCLSVATPAAAYSILHNFSAGVSDGAYPVAALIWDSVGNLYGTTNGGGPSGVGTVFTLKTDGTGYTLLHIFAGGEFDGANPQAALILDGAGNLYGTTNGGGSSGGGTVFTLATDGTVTILHSFADGASDGVNPRASLIFDDAGNLYRTAFAGGSSAYGTVFMLP